MVAVAWHGLEANQKSMAMIGFASVLSAFGQNGGQGTGRIPLEITADRTTKGSAASISTRDRNMIRKAMGVDTSLISATLLQGFMAQTANADCETLADDGTLCDVHKSFAVKESL